MLVAGAVIAIRNKLPIKLNLFLCKSNVLRVVVFNQGIVDALDVETDNCVVHPLHTVVRQT